MKQVEVVGFGDLNQSVSAFLSCPATHCFAKALASENFIFIPAHPGWVVTDMVRPSSRA